MHLISVLIRVMSQFSYLEEILVLLKFLLSNLLGK